MKGRHYYQSLQDIIDAAEDIEKFMAGMNLERLTGDRKTLFAVAKALENIGEAVKQILLPCATSIQMFRGKTWRA